MAKLTLVNKLIIGNRKQNAAQVGAASALIMAVAGYRGLEDEGKEVNVVKLATFAMATGAAAGVIWGMTKYGLKRPGKQDKELIRRSVMPVIAIGIGSTLRDIEDDRIFRRYDDYDTRGSSSRYSSYRSPYSSSSSSSSSSRYPSRVSSTTKRYISSIEDDDDESIMDDAMLETLAVFDSNDDKYGSVLEGILDAD